MANLHAKNPNVIKPLKESMTKSLQKYNKTKDQASQAGMLFCHNLIPKIHPLLIQNIDEKEQTLIDFREQLKTYKPKQCNLEVGIQKAKDGEKLSMLREAMAE